MLNIIKAVVDVALNSTVANTAEQLAGSQMASAMYFCDTLRSVEWSKIKLRHINPVA